ncbi:iron uptake transporter deferrochelatase/peroxidase subunit [Demequina sp.]|uniref:iron uptake transporter deferrochelatase/peroxidase subunit n=1 Tax=Demequina sp. TaxID=2050685 RepID=UPI0025C4B531|nr:iron uptake transporter deferrochelatase/peroxidase subunit [Demequina sp.]
MSEQRPSPTPPAEDATPSDEGPGRSAKGPSRRAVLGVAGAAAGIAASGGIGFQVGRQTAPPPGEGQFPFLGAHQSGILTPQQDRLHFAAFDITTDSRDRVIALLRRWTQAAATLMAGSQVGGGAVGGPDLLPPDDTGEALDLGASGLTITFGFGRSMFLADGADRFGLADALPDQLLELPHFAGDALEQNLSHGDLCIQACANDPQVAVHAIRNLARLAIGDAHVRWAQLGFGRTSSTTRAQKTPRNLMGFKDGTANIRAEDKGLVDRWLWADGSDGQQWMHDGTYLVARKIRILIENWDRTSLSEQEDAVGRTKGSGAPLSGGNEFTDPNFRARDSAGSLLIPTDSHVTIAHPSRWDGVKMLRRGFNYTDGADALGKLDGGLFFIAFVRDPRAQYVPMQEEMSRADRMTVEYLRTVGSAVFAVPPGVAQGSSLGDGGAYIGEALFA